MLVLLTLMIPHSLAGPPPASAGEQISPLRSSKESERRWATDARVDPEGWPIPIVMVGAGVGFDDADNVSRIAMLSRKKMGVELIPRVSPFPLSW